MSLPYIVIDGRATDNAELRFTQTGKAVASFRVAASDSRKDDNGNWETTEQLFVNVSVWDNAEQTAEKILKGSRVTVAGRIHEREYEHNGEKRRSLEIKYPMVSVLPDQRQGQRPTPQQGSGQWGQQSANDPWANVGGNGNDNQPPF